MILALWACETSVSAPTQPVPAGPEQTWSPVEGRQDTFVVRDHAGEVSQYLKHLARADKKVTAYPLAPGPHLERAQLLFTLARLRGGTEDIEEAERSLAIAWRQAPEQPSVRRAQATWLQRNHRFREALELMEPLNEPSDQAFKASARFELGDYQASIHTLEQLLEGQRFPDPSLSGRLAVCYWKTGRFEAAEEQLRIAQSNDHGRERWVPAWRHLVLGLMDLDQDRLGDALLHYKDAEAVFPGWWLIHEHMAEVYRLQGHPEQALPIYEEVVATTGSPELMGALADTLTDLDRLDEAKVWVERAMGAFREQLKRNPTGAGGHALKFFLAHGEPEETLVLARANHALRPNGEAKLLLAEALEATGQQGEAEALREEVVASGWWVAPTE